MKTLTKYIIKFTALLLLTGGICRAMENESSCPICLENTQIKVQLLPCGHRFCFDCMKKHHKSLLSINIARTYNFLKPNCPVCRSAFLEVNTVGSPESEDIKPFSFGFYKAESREEKIHVLAGLKMPELIKQAKKNLIENGIATEENATQHLQDAIEYLYTGFVEQIEQLSDQCLINFIKASLTNTQS